MEISKAKKRTIKFNLSLDSNVIFDLLFLLYIFGLLAHKTAVGFDAIFCRVTFVLYIGYFIFWLFYNKEKNKIYFQRNMTFFLWYLVFTFFGLLSLLWATSVPKVFSYLNNFVQILGIAFTLGVRIQNKEDVVKYIIYFVIGILYACLIVIIRTPASDWEKNRIGGVLGTHENAFGNYVSTGFILCFWLMREQKSVLKKIFYMLLCLLFLIFSLYSGSRGSVIKILIGAILLVFLMLKKGKNRFLLLLIVIVGAMFVYNILVSNYFFYSIIGKRLVGLVNYLQGNGESVDSSTLERLYFIDFATDLFKLKPWFGFGLNNFAYQLELVSYRHAVYAHNNYWELLSDLGVIGTLLYYSIFGFYLYLFISKKSNSSLSKFALAILLISIIFDYTTISYQNVFSLSIVFLATKAIDFSESNTQKVYYGKKILQA
jgi:O-antigen ligase